MIKTTVSIVLVLLLSVFLCIKGANAEGYSTISGYVLEEGAGKPIVGHTVTAIKMNSAETYVINGITDGNGFYLITDAISGTYRVSLNGLELYRTNYYSTKDTIEVIVSENKNIVNNDFTVKKAGYVSGRVFRGDTATPYVGVRVVASTEDGYQLTASTDKDGSYKIGGLPDTEEAVVGAFASGVGIKYVEHIQIVGGEETKNIDIVLVKDTTTLSIEGRVLSSDSNEGIGDITILLMGRESLAKIVTAENGNFEVYGLPSGTYSVMIAEFGYEFFNEEGIELEEGKTPLEIEFILKPENDNTSP